MENKKNTLNDIDITDVTSDFDYFNKKFGDQGLDSYKPVERISTGFDSIDALLGNGLVPGIYAFAATSGLGKSTLCKNIADNIARSGREVIFYSLELNRDVMLFKSLARIGLDDNGGLYQRAPSFEELLTKNSSTLSIVKRDTSENAYCEYMSKIAPRMHVITETQVDQGGLKHFLEKLEKLIASLSKEKPCVVFIDYLQYLFFGGDRDIRLQIDETVRKLHEIADKHRTPIILVNSTSKGATHDKTGSDEYIKESEGIKFTAVATLVLYQNIDSTSDEFKKAKEHRRRPMWLNIRKNRYGKPDLRIPLEFDGAYATFKEMPNTKPVSIYGKKDAKDSSEKKTQNRKR